MKRIVLTGGGTAGHVTPNLALLPSLKEAGFEIHYIGSKNGIERELVEKEGIPYYGISSGKLRRYLSKENITDILKVTKGVAEAVSLMERIKPDIIFSKGGFVAVPVVLAGKMKGIPVVIHESDMTPGLANKIAMPFAKTVCTTFPETVKHVKGGKGVCTGTPIREELFCGNKAKGLSLCGFREEKPVIMMMGGSLGSVKINQCLRNSLEDLLKDFQIIHLCGKGNLDKQLLNKEGYQQFEYISEELPHLFAATTVLISRAGSNAISEFLALKKPSLLIPLSAKVSRGDQILNARSFQKRGFSVVIVEEELTEERLTKGISKLYQEKDKYRRNMEAMEDRNGIYSVMEAIESAVKKK